MKKLLTAILLFAMLLSLCACGTPDSKPVSDQLTINDVSVTFPELEVEATADPDMLASEPTTETEPSGGISYGVIDFTMPEMNFDIDIGGIEMNYDHTIDFEIPAIEYDFTSSPIEIEVNGFSFEFPDYQFDFDDETFDVHTFIETSSNNFSEESIDQLTDMEEEAIILIAETRANILADLSHAFETSGLEVTVNSNTGEIILDASVLFGFDQSAVSAEGKDFLKKFLAVYTTVVFNEKYEGFISKVMVEGHTDTDGDYNYNLILSQKRAENVAAFCLSEDSQIDAKYITALASSLETIGYSYDHPIYDENGNVDKAASRRVSFRFLISLP